MSTPNPASLRVAECRGCHQLFAVYATEGAVACPNCGTPVEIAALETAPLGVAEPIEVRIEVTAPAQPPVEPPAAEPVAEPVAEEPAVEEPASTVADWLIRDKNPAAPDLTGAETLPEPEFGLDPKPTLSESLGWKESLPGFDPPAPAADAPSQAEASPAAESYAEVGPSSDEFRFDFGATPLSEGEDHANTAESSEVSLDLTTPSSVDDESAPQAAELSWDRMLATTERERRGWFAPLATLAGVALVAAGAGFLLLDGNPSEAVAEANRESRLLALGEEEDPTPPNPFPAADTLASSAPEPGGAESVFDRSIVDPATVPVAYDAPGLAEPEEADLSALSDPVAALPGANPPAGEASRELPQLKTLPPTPTVASAAREEIGLIGGPTTSLDDLAATLSEAEAAGKAFAEGDLDDPEQASEIGQRYAQLSYLAQVVTLLDPEERSPRRVSVEMQAADVFNRVFFGQRARDQSLRVAGPWIDWSGRPHGGVFFAGDPIHVSRAGEVMRYDFVVGEQTIRVLMAEPLDTRRLLVRRAVSIGVLGVVVEDPQKWIAGYEGEAERVVWARKTLPLAAPVEL